VSGFKDSPVWATAVSWKVEGGGFVPRLYYLSVEGAHYYADTHVSDHFDFCIFSKAGCRV